MKSLYDDDFRMTNDGREVDNVIHARMAVEFDSWVRKGYSPREISHIMMMSLFDMELSAVLEHGCEKYLKKVDTFLEKQKVATPTATKKKSKKSGVV